MASFSPFWATHYKDIGFCCVLWPLQSHQVFEGNKIIEFIDTDWMDSKKLKWIGWDKQGYYAWIDSDGTIYNFSDLKRNDTGKEYESTKERIRIPGDGNSDNSQAAISGDFYEYELSILKRCGFCPGPAGPSEPDDSESSADTGGGGKKTDDKDNAVTPSWQGLAQGAIPDYAGIYGGKNVVTDSSDATYNGYVTAANKYGASYGAGGGDASGGGSKNDTIPKIPYSGLVPLPTGVPTPQSMPYVPVPGLPKNPVARTDGVIAKIPNPIDKARVELPFIPKGTLQPMPVPEPSKPKSYFPPQQPAQKPKDNKPASPPSPSKTPNTPNNSNNKGQQRADKAIEMTKKDVRVYGVGSGKIDCSGATKEISKAVDDGAFDKMKYDANFATSLAANQAKCLNDNGDFTTDINQVQVGDYIFWTGESSASIKNIDHTGIVISVNNGVVTVASAETANHTNRSFRQATLSKTGVIWQKHNGTGGKKFVGAGRPKP